MGKKSFNAKKRVKSGQLSLLFSLMVIGILVLIVLISISNYNHGLNKNLKGELGTGNIYPMVGGPCVNGDSDTIMKLSSSTNGHGALWNNTDYFLTICYSSIFGGTYSGANPHDCIFNNMNKIMGLSDITNAHLEIPSSSNYGINVCYGNISCRNVSGDCNADERAIIAMSADTNAHVSNQGGISYPINICCKSSIECTNNNQCSGNFPRCNIIGHCVQCLNESDCMTGQNCSSTGECISPPDNIPPIISSLESSPASRSAEITWNTNENSNSSIIYGTNISNLNNTSIDANRGMIHSIELSGLTSLTLYYYNVTCCDSYNNCATNGTNSFTTNNYTGGSPNPNPNPNNTTKIIFVDKSVEVGNIIEFIVSSEGLNQSKLNFSVKNLPNSATFDIKTGRFSWIPSSVGVYTINFTVTDKKYININVVKITVNEAIPIPTPIPQPTPTPTPAPNKSGKIIFWIIVIVIIIIAIIIVVILIIFVRNKKYNQKNQPNLIKRFPPPNTPPNTPNTSNPPNMISRRI